jgi:diguanylate cyclase (GGDEF)-like protein
VQNARLFAETVRLARTDSLTGIANRHHLFEVGAQELSRARRFGHRLSALMLDIDHFKAVNDMYGHASGDEVLRGVARACLDVTRDIDIVARYGGEEFVILLPETDMAGAYLVGERLREHVEQTVTETERGAVGVTISVGIAILEPESNELASLLSLADKALYEAKQAGRNRIAGQPGKQLEV